MALPDLPAIVSPELALVDPLIAETLRRAASVPFGGGNPFGVEVELPRILRGRGPAEADPAVVAECAQNALTQVLIDWFGDHKALPVRVVARESVEVDAGQPVAVDASAQSVVIDVASQPVVVDVAPPSVVVEVASQPALTHVEQPPPGRPEHLAVAQLIEPRPKARPAATQTAARPRQRPAVESAPVQRSSGGFRRLGIAAVLATAALGAGVASGVLVLDPLALVPGAGSGNEAAAALTPAAGDGSQERLDTQGSPSAPSAPATTGAEPKPSGSTTSKTEVRAATAQSADAPRSSEGTAPKPTKSAVASAKTLRLAWAPDLRAKGYSIELFRGTKRILTARSSEPTYLVRKRWSAAGKMYRLTPGKYRWYVWTIGKNNKRAAVAIVQSTLVVS